MKKYYVALGLAACMSLTNIAVFAQEVIPVPISVPVEKGVASIHQINMEVPITRAEFITTIIKAHGVELHPIMDTHYALPAMQKAEELGLIDLEKYPMDTWSQVMTAEEKSEVLTKAMQNGIDMGKVYTALSQVLVDNVEVDGKLVDFKGLPFTHDQGHLMVPVRPLAEAMGFEVTWDKDTYSATLNNGKIKSTVQVGFDSYNYSSVVAIGMSAPFSVGAAPRFIDGTMYVPVEYFTMFADMEIADHTVHFTMK